MTQLTQYDMQARARALAERANAAGQGGETWRPDQTDSGHPNPLIGEYLLSSYATTEPVAGRPERREIAILRDTAGGLWSVWINSTVLIDEWEAQQPNPGDLVYVRYDGVVSKPGRAAYRKYTLAIDRASGERHVRGDAVAEAEPAQPVVGERHAPVVEQHDLAPVAAAPAADASACQACGFLNGFHRDGCPLATSERYDPSTADIPF